jgi:Trp operon repressor
VRKGVTFMTEEVRRYGVVSALLEGKMTNREAAEAIGVSIRQVKRIRGKVKREGP